MRHARRTSRHAEASPLRALRSGSTHVLPDSAVDDLLVEQPGSHDGDPLGGIANGLAAGAVLWGLLALVLLLAL